VVVVVAAVAAAAAAGAALSVKVHTHTRDNLKGAGLGRTAASKIARSPCMQSLQLVIDFIHEMQLQRGQRQLEG
jgi:hypothetical protein